MARPVKLTEDLQNKIVSILEKGNYVETACALAGISKQTFYNWRNRGNTQKSGKYRGFLDAVEKAIATAEIADLKIIDQAAQKNWRAAAWLLERRSPERWGNKR